MGRNRRENQVKSVKICELIKLSSPYLANKLRHIRRSAECSSSVKIITCILHIGGYGMSSFFSLHSLAKSTRFDAGLSGIP